MELLIGIAVIAVGYFLVCFLVDALWPGFVTFVVLEVAAFFLFGGVPSFMHIVFGVLSAGVVVVGLMGDSSSDYSSSNNYTPSSAANTYTSYVGPYDSMCNSNDASNSWHDGINNPSDDDKIWWNNQIEAQQAQQEAADAAVRARQDAADAAVRARQDAADAAERARHGN